MARRTLTGIKGEIASRHEEEVDLVLFRLDLFAYGIDILYKRSVCLDKHYFTL